MARNDIRKFNWLPRQSASAGMQNWREKQRAQRERTDTFAATADGLNSTIINLGTGMAEIAARQATARVDAAVQAKVTSVNTLV